MNEQPIIVERFGLQGERCFLGLAVNQPSVTATATAIVEATDAARIAAIKKTERYKLRESLKDKRAELEKELAGLRSERDKMQGKREKLLTQRGEAKKLNTQLGELHTEAVGLDSRIGAASADLVTVKAAIDKAAIDYGDMASGTMPLADEQTVLCNAIFAKVEAELQRLAAVALALRMFASGANERLRNQLEPPDKDAPAHLEQVTTDHGKPVGNGFYQYIPAIPGGKVF